MVKILQTKGHECPGTADPSKEEALSVSILMLLKNHRSFLEQSFTLIQKQAYPGPVEIVYIDSGSTDGTCAFMEERGVQAHRIPPEAFHHGRTRNLAASLARGEILVSLSGDAVPAHDQWLNNLIRHFDDPKVGAVYGRQIPPNDTGPVRRQIMSSEYPETVQVRSLDGFRRPHPGLFRFSNVNAAFRAAVWRRFPWNETVLLAEDQGMCRDVLTAGMKVIYDPEASVYHGHERSLLGEFRFAVENGISLARLGILNHPDIQGTFRYGLHRMRQDVGHFLARKEFFYAAHTLLVYATKCLGVQIGKREGRWPSKWFSRSSRAAASRTGDPLREA
jgi:rhamnosyltransferase